MDSRGGDSSGSVPVLPLGRRRTKEEAFHILAKMVMQQTNEDYVRSFLLTYKKFSTSSVDVVKTWRRQYPFPPPPPPSSSSSSFSSHPPPKYYYSLIRSAHVYEGVRQARGRPGPATQPPPDPVQATPLLLLLFFVYFGVKLVSTTSATWLPVTCLPARDGHFIQRPHHFTPLSCSLDTPACSSSCGCGWRSSPTTSRPNRRPVRRPDPPVQQKAGKIGNHGLFFCVTRAPTVCSVASGDDQGAVLGAGAVQIQAAVLEDDIVTSATAAASAVAAPSQQSLRQPLPFSALAPGHYHLLALPQPRRSTAPTLRSFPLSLSLFG